MIEYYDKKHACDTARHILSTVSISKEPRRSEDVFNSTIIPCEKCGARLTFRAYMDSKTHLCFSLPSSLSFSVIPRKKEGIKRFCDICDKWALPSEFKTIKNGDSVITYHIQCTIPIDYESAVKKLEDKKFSKYKKNIYIC